MGIAHDDPPGAVSGTWLGKVTLSVSVKVSSIRYAAPTTHPRIVLIQLQRACLHPLPEMVYMLPLGLSVFSLADSRAVLPGPSFRDGRVSRVHVPALLCGSEGHGLTLSARPRTQDVEDPGGLQNSEIHQCSSRNQGPSGPGHG